MNNEVWKCISNLGWNTYLESLESINSSLSLILKDSDEEKEIILKFEDVLCYRYADEGHRGRTIIALNDTHILQEGTLFSVKNSKYIAWLVGSTHNADKLKDAKHYVYFDSDNCIDIVALKELDLKCMCPDKKLRNNDEF